MGVVLDIADAKLILERYDSDCDGRLGFWEFSCMLLPIEPIMRDQLERKKQYIELGYETGDLIRRLFRKLVDLESLIEMSRQRIEKERVSIRSAFDGLDWLGRGFITENEFKRSYD
eukprot:CAMPEP_0202962946 /NCGR_PEP_ID=MMETSP1396-20130829/6962_1 /ASSEMBLY_ACC=CAM_ASM_000872 /TAXON_ID= /ORGANISM="Pseudokeronopsis sp., Strain Brazil" /LENGTH=115 /DNA_ID=CAMNT_0049683793 /DNA_START=876 /DNA_END=1223 /DNA_ORIENTATION=-